MKNFTKITAKDLELGMRFSAPVFFDDGENMFLAEYKAVKPYHLAAIERWNIRYLLTYGHPVTEKDFDDSEEYPYEVEVLEEMKAV